MSNIVDQKEVVLYTRTSRELTVEAKVVKGTEVLKAATDTEAAVTRSIADYTIVGTFEGKEVLNEEGAGYRQTVNRGRKAFKELWEKYVADKVAAENKAKAEAAAKKKEEKEKLREEKAIAKAKEKAARDAERAEKKAKAKAEKEAKLAEEKAARQSKGVYQEPEEVAPQEAE